MLCIYNARLILADRIVDQGWVLVEKDLINAIGQGVPPDGYERVDAKGFCLASGFIDIQVHGGGGGDFLDGTAETFQTAADFHLAGGTTGICPTAATATYDDFDSF
jgi:N-acetylglucosamine-6-phosphate deacetylase